MFNVMTELFLKEYFLLNYFVDSKDDSNKIYKALKDMYFIDSKEAKRIDELINSNEVKALETEDDYKRYLRIKQYNEFLGKEVQNTLVDDVVCIKGEFVKLANKYSFNLLKKVSNALIEQTLIAAATGGNIYALNVLGFFQLEGLIVNRNVVAGLNNLAKATRWGQINSALMYLKYDKNENIIKLFNSIVDNSLYSDIRDRIYKKYDIKSTELCKEYLLINKAIANHKLKGDYYDEVYDRFIFSDVISYKDKEKILLIEDKNIISDLCDLPLNLTSRAFNMNYDVFDNTSYKTKENDEIVGHLKRFNKAPNAFGLLIESDYLIDKYIDKFKEGFIDTNVNVIEVNELREIDLNPNLNNVFIRDIDENKNNIYLLVLRGRIKENITSVSKLFVKESYRQRFFINQPAVSLNLSKIIPIIITDKENYDSVKDLADFVELGQINNKEKNQIIKEMSKDILKDNQTEKLSSLSLEKARVIINKISACEMDDVDKFIDDYLNDLPHNRVFGFGGRTNENK